MIAEEKLAYYLIVSVKIMLRTAPRLLPLAILAAGCLRPAVASAAERTCFLGSTLPAGKYRAETFTLGIPKELAGVQARFAEAVARNQDWVQAYVAKLGLKPGEILPYDEHLGVTKTEYEALTKAYANPSAISLETIDLEVACKQGTMRLHAPSPYDFVGQVEIDGAGKLRGPVRLEAQAQAVKSRRARFGVWTGTTWYFESVDPARKDAQQLELSIGKLDGTGRLFLHFSYVGNENGARPISKTLLAWITLARFAPAEGGR